MITDDVPPGRSASPARARRNIEGYADGAALVTATHGGAAVGAPAYTASP